MHMDSILIKSSLNLFSYLNLDIRSDIRASRIYTLFGNLLDYKVDVLLSQILTWTSFTTLRKRVEDEIKTCKDLRVIF